MKSFKFDIPKDAKITLLPESTVSPITWIKTYPVEFTPDDEKALLWEAYEVVYGMKTGRRITELKPDVFLWCDENIEKGMTLGRSVHLHYRDGIHSAIFDREIDAIAFKLRWIGGGAE